jgi:hypothetical protein
MMVSGGASRYDAGHIVVVSDPFFVHFYAVNVFINVVTHVVSLAPVAWLRRAPVSLRREDG